MIRAGELLPMLGQVLALWTLQMVVAIISWSWLTHSVWWVVLWLAMLAATVAIIGAAARHSWRQAWWVLALSALPQLLIQGALLASCMGLLPAWDPLLVLAQFVAVSYYPLAYRHATEILLALPIYLWATALGPLAIWCHVAIGFHGYYRHKKRIVG